MDNYAGRRDTQERTGYRGGARRHEGEDQVAEATLWLDCLVESTSFTMNRALLTPQTQICSADWKRIVAYGLIVYLAALGLRFAVYPDWRRDPTTHIGDAPIMSTPDSYAWLSGAKGAFLTQDEPLAVLARALAILGPSLDDIGYFAPVFIASLVGPVMVLWAWTLGALEAGLAAGLMTSLSPAYFGRTHLGFYDTDMVTLLFPLLAGWAVAHWLRPFLTVRVFASQRLIAKGQTPKVTKQGRRREKNLAKNRVIATATEPPRAEVKQSVYFWAFVIGLFIRFSNPWHERLPDFNLVLFYVAIVCVLTLSARDARPLLLWGLAVLGAVAFHGWGGCGGAVTLLLLFRYRPAWFARLTRSVWPALIALGCLMVLEVSMLETIRSRFLYYLQRYLVPVGSAQAADTSLLSQVADRTLSYPAIAQSVAEDSRLGLDFLELLHWWQWPAALGFVGFATVVIMRPVALCLLPLSAIGLSGLFLGARMAMFGAPAVALGIALPLFWAMERLASHSWRRFIAACASLGLGVLFLLPGLFEYPHLSPKSCISPEFGRGLIELSKMAPTGSLVWAWWDWGYAVNYFSRLPSFANGGQKRHMGVIYPLSLVLGTSNPLQASQMIRYAAQNPSPWKTWNALSPDKANEFFSGLATKKFDYKAKDKQYLGVNIEAFSYLDWIMLYASWDFFTKQGAAALAQEIEGPFNLDTKNGIVAFANKPMSLALASIDIMATHASKHLEFPSNSGPHLIYCEPAKMSYLLDDRAYNSMLVRLLLGSPTAPEFSDFFKLVYDGYPMVRIYEVL